AGFRHQAAADRQHLLLAARQRTGALRASLGQTREDREYASAVLLAALAAAAVGAEIEVFADRHVREDTPALGHVDQALPDDRGRTRALDRSVSEADGALPGAGH